MGLRDLFEGRRGLVRLIAVGVIAAVVGTTVAIIAWGGRSEDRSDAARDVDVTSGDALVAVVSRPGGFVVEAPEVLVGDRVGRGVKLTTRPGDLVITVAPSGSDGLAAAHESTLGAIQSTYSDVRVDGRVRTTMGGLRARRSVGAIARESGDELIFSVTTAARGRRTWSVAMFAARGIKPARLERFYQPVLDGFRVLE